MPIVQNSKRIPWARIFAEGVLIVVSILLAFAIDAAWDRHQERGVTRRHLQALVSEIREIQVDLRGEIKGTESSGAGSRTVLKFMTSRSGNLTQKELWNALDMSFDVGIFSSESPVLTMMLASGELMDLGSDSLVPVLTLWQGELEHLRTTAIKRSGSYSIERRLYLDDQSSLAYPYRRITWVPHSLGCLMMTE